MECCYSPIDPIYFYLINSVFFCLFFSFNMDPIFKNKTDIKKEYENLQKNILPMLNECGNCNKFKCNYCLKFSVNCNLSIKTKCKNGDKFNKSKDILLNCGIFQIELYVQNSLVGYFNMNDLTKEFFKMNISEEMQQKNP